MAGKSQIVWNDYRKAELKKLREEGWTTGELQRHFECTPGALSGALNRMGLRKQQQYRPRPEKKAGTTLADAIQTITYVGPGQSRELPTVQRKISARTKAIQSLIEEKKKEDPVKVQAERNWPFHNPKLKETYGTVEWEYDKSDNPKCWQCVDFATDCRWPVRDEPHQFCGHKIVEGTSYCAKHLLKGTTPARKQYR